MSHIELSQIRYNPVTGAYEARADISKGGRTYRYPCSVSGSLMMEDAVIRQSLKQQAQRMALREGGLLSVR